MSSIFKRLGNFIKKEYSYLDPKVKVGGTKFGLNPMGSTATAIGDAVGGGDTKGDFLNSTKDFANTAGVIAPFAVGGAALGAGGAPAVPATASTASTAAGLAPMALSFLDKLGGLGGIADKGLGIAQILNAANLQKQSTGYAKNAYDTATTSYGERAPLRVAGIEGLLHPQTQDVSSLGQIPGNPFAKKAPMPIPATVGARPIAVPPVNQMGGY